MNAKPHGKRNERNRTVFEHLLLKQAELGIGENGIAVKPCENFAFFDFTGKTVRGKANLG